MAKCPSCGERKMNRFCRGMNTDICSLCCGTKREKEILCPEDCEYLKKGKDYQLGREITRKISVDLQAESEDLFGTDQVADFVMPMERMFVDQFYRDTEVNDNHIYEAHGKIYAFQAGMVPVLKGETRTEEVIFKKFHEVNKRASDLHRAASWEIEITLK